MPKVGYLAFFCYYKQMETHRIKFRNFEWINLIDPARDEMEKIAREFNFHPLSLDDVLSRNQRPKIDDYEDYLFMVFHLPRYIKRNLRTIALEIDVFMGKKFIITVHSGELKPLNTIFADCEDSQKRDELGGKGPGYLLYRILSHSFDYCFPMLDKINQKIDRLEDELYLDQSERTLEEVSLVTRDIINFRRIINPQRFVIKDLENKKYKYIAESLDIYFDDIGDRIERIWEMLDNFKEVIGILQDTNESVMTRRLNEIIKTLTIFSVIMLPLTVITGFYGMNVSGLPIASNKFASEIIIFFLVLVILGMLFYFKKKKWL